MARNAMMNAFKFKINMNAPAAPPAQDSNQTDNS